MRGARSGIWLGDVNYRLDLSKTFGDEATEMKASQVPPSLRPDFALLRVCVGILRCERHARACGRREVGRGGGLSDAERAGPRSATNTC
eukprot:2889473-Rhodomonas_salina.1